MISSSEVGGCCRVQVAWLPPAPLSLAPSSIALSSFSSSSSSSLASCRHSAFPLLRWYSLSISLSLSLFLPRSPYRPFNPLRALGYSTKLQKFRPHHRRRRGYARTAEFGGLQGCSPFYPGGCCQERVDYLWGHGSNCRIYTRTSGLSISAGIVSVIKDLHEPAPERKHSRSVSCADEFSFLLSMYLIDTIGYDASVVFISPFKSRFQSENRLDAAIFHALELRSCFRVPPTGVNYTFNKFRERSSPRASSRRVTSSPKADALHKLRRSHIDLEIDGAELSGLKRAPRIQSHLPNLTNKFYARGQVPRKHRQLQSERLGRRCLVPSCDALERFHKA